MARPVFAHFKASGFIWACSYISEATSRRKMTRKACWLFTLVVVGLNFIYFLHRVINSDYCNVDELMKDRATAVGDRSVISCLSAADTTRRRPVTAAAPWCTYTDEVDLRIIVLTFNRRDSLLRLLSSVNDLELDGASVAIEIWIDRDKHNKVDSATLEAAHSFQWQHGKVRVHVHEQHAGIYGQWINTWRPWNATSKEMALILEDDVSVSPYAYRWLYAARSFYANRTDVAGLTLQSEGLMIASTGQPFTKFPSARHGAAFMMEQMGSWGFVPRAEVWIGFQDWFAKVRAETPDFKPYVPGIVMTSWYKSFEKQNKADSMWTMWFIYYYSQVRGALFTVFSNIRQLADNSTGQATFVAVNRREPGLHYAGKATDNTKLLLRTWRREFAKFSRTPVVFRFNGERVVNENVEDNDIRKG